MALRPAKPPEVWPTLELGHTAILSWFFSNQSQWEGLEVTDAETKISDGSKVFTLARKISAAKVNNVTAFLKTKLRDQYYKVVSKAADDDEAAFFLH